MNYKEKIEKYILTIKKIETGLSHKHIKVAFEKEYLANINQAKNKEILVKKNG